MTRKSANCDIVTLDDGRQICLSYGVIVAAFLPYRGFVLTDRKFSATSTRHARAFVAAATAETLPHDALVALCAPVASRVFTGRIQRGR